MENKIKFQAKKNGSVEVMGSNSRSQNTKKKKWKQALFLRLAI